MATEFEFANKLVQLLSVTTSPSFGDQQIVDTFKLSDVTKLPNNFTFPPLAHPFIAKPIGSVDEEDLNEDDAEYPVEFTFKSLKQPKFSLSLILDIKKSSNIYMVKTALTHLLRNTPEIGIIVDAADIKLMIRTKTLQDSENVLHVLENAGSKDRISFNVLISKFTKAEDIEESSKESTEKSVFTISEDSWERITDILLVDLKDKDLVQQTLLKFKNSL